MKFLKISSTALLLLTLTACNTDSSNTDTLTTTSNTEIPYEASALYQEYPFDSGDDVDMRFTHRALEQLESEEDLLSEESTVIEDQSMTYVKPSFAEMEEGIIDKYEWEGDVYELRGKAENKTRATYQIMKNGELLFEAEMGFGAEGPIIDWRIINGKAAFTFNVEEILNGNSVTYTHDIWYDGELMSEKFSVENPRYLFSYNGNLGFVASSNGSDSVFYDGKFISPGFTEIWTANCCSYTEILPTVYENGTLLFYAKRDGTNYLVETSLITKDETAAENTATSPEEAFTFFFDALRNNEFEKAAAYFDFEGQKDGLAYGSSEEAPKRLEEYCEMVLTCLEGKILKTEQVSSDKYTLSVQFLNEDGSIYVFGPCCGASEEEMPSRDTFDFTVEKIDGVYKVTTIPLYVP